MDCPYRENAFCAACGNEALGQLCGSCVPRKYSKGQYLSSRYIGLQPCLQVSGLTIMRIPSEDSDKKWTTVGLASGGDLLSECGLLNEGSRVMSGDNDILCLTECTLACFEPAAFRHLFNTNASFALEVCRNRARFCGTDVMTMMQEVGFKDAYAAVRYIVKYCRDHGIPQLTHEQIALACNRSRTTVTEIMYRLTQNEPDLFRQS